MYCISDSIEVKVGKRSSWSWCVVYGARSIILFFYDRLTIHQERYIVVDLFDHLLVIVGPFQVVVVNLNSFIVLVVLTTLTRSRE